jgi:hypothetical protein
VARPIGVFIMAIALAGYVGTMLAALIVLIMAWYQVVGPSPGERARQPSHPIGAVATMPMTVTAKLPDQFGPPVVQKADDGADTADEARAAAEKQAAADAEKAKRQRQAYAKKRKEQLARQQDPQYSTALGYDQERSSDQQHSSGSFNLFGPRRY